MKLIKIAQDHFVIADNSEIKEGDYYLFTWGGEQEIQRFSKEQYADRENHRHLYDNACKKITHSTQPLEWFGGEIIFLSEVKELIGEVDVIKRKDEYLKKVKEEVKDYEQHDRIYILGTSDLAFTEGYNQALKDNKEKKYTEEDMKVAITQAFLSGVERLEDFERVQEMILDNVKPKTEWEVKFVDGKLALKK